MLAGMVTVSSRLIGNDAAEIRVRLTRIDHSKQQYWILKRMNTQNNFVNPQNIIEIDSKEI